MKDRLMKKTDTINRHGRLAILTGLCLLCIFLCAVIASAEASDIPDLSMNGKCSICVTFRDKFTDELIPGGRLEFIQVASVEADNGFYFVPVGGFASEDFNFDLSETANLSDPQLALDLEAFERNHYKSEFVKTEVEVGSTGELAGTAILDQMDLGLYLVREIHAAEGYHKISPFLVTIPQKEQDHLIYQVDASPKPERVTTVGEKCDISVNPSINKIIDLIMEAEKLEQGDAIPLNSQFHFKFERLDGESPMPVNNSGAVSQGGHVVSQTQDELVLELVGPGRLDIGVITFNEAGQYFYQISEIQGSNEKYIYDEKVFWLKYEIKITEDGHDLELGRIVLRQDNANGEIISDMDVAEFENYYVEPWDKKGFYEEPSPTPEITEHTEEYVDETPTPEPEESPAPAPQYSPTPTPAVTPYTPGGGNYNPPSDRLPQTGQLWWPVWLLCGIGGILIASGLIAKKRKR